jgi:hypothetical protein
MLLLPGVGSQVQEEAGASWQAAMPQLEAQRLQAWAVEGRIQAKMRI